MNPLLERVAAAMESHWVWPGGQAVYTGKGATFPKLVAAYETDRAARAACRELNARAAVAAMREPTQQMMAAAPAFDDMDTGHLAARAWRAMIDEALR